MTQPVSARAEGLSVIYTYPDGTKVQRIKGSRSWRNNNPGNLRHGIFTKCHGAIGEAGGFAVFPSAVSGLKALTALLQTPRYQKLTLSLAINRYAPHTENDTLAYLAFILHRTKITPETVLSTLSATQITQMASAIQEYEGFHPGQSIPLQNQSV